MVLKVSELGHLAWIPGTWRLWPAAATWWQYSPPPGMRIGPETARQRQALFGRSHGNYEEQKSMVGRRQESPFFSINV